MTAHELAKKLLEGPDVEVITKYAEEAGREGEFDWIIEAVEYCYEGAEVIPGQNHKEQHCIILS